MEFDRAQLKWNVKLSMKNTRPSPILVTLLFSVVVSVGTWLINTVLGWLLTGGMGRISDTVLIYMQQGYEMQQAMYIAMLELFRRGPGAVFSVVMGGLTLSIIIALWQSAMGVGYKDYCLSMVRGDNPPMGRIFNALPRLGQVLVTRVLTGIFEALWSLLVLAGCCVMFVAAVALDMPFISPLLLFLDWILMALGVAWLTMRYALVDYVLLDKGLSGMEAIRESKRMMQGNIGRGFMLQLSFFGWGLLIMAIGGTGVLVPLAVILSQLGGYGMSMNMDGLLAAAGVSLLIAAAASIVVTVLILWLQPYVNGCWASFYDWAKGTPAGSGGGAGYGGGWSGPGDYTWSSGSSSRGTGMGPGSGNGGPSTHNPPKPRDDPWN